MVEAVFLDAGPLGLVTTRDGQSPEADACRDWMEGLLDAGVHVCVAEVTDYEVRRELIRANKTAGIARLNRLKSVTEYLPITTEAMLQAAELWARARTRGVVTADALSLDGDVILAAQVVTCGLAANAYVVATTNVRHLAHYVAASQWRDIVL